ncbi:MAG: hypothetical protein Q7V88_14620 [Actinomycetota bacterium]|nr:hypothetical protein [Actinomycetota bacterium]
MNDEPSHQWAPPSVPPPHLHSSRGRSGGGRLPLLVGGVSALALVVGVVTWQLGGSDDDDATLAGVGASYHLVSYPSAVGGDTVVVADADGANPVTYDLPEGLGPQWTPGNWLIDTDDDKLQAMDLSTGEVSSIELPSADLTVAGATLVAGSDEVVLFSAFGDMGPVVVDLAGGTVRPLVAGLEQGFAASVRGGVQLFSAGDSDGPATILAPVSEPASAWTVPGAVLDVRDRDSLVVSGDDEIVIQRYSGTDAAGSPAQVPMRPAGGLLVGDHALVVDPAGALTDIDLATGVTSTRGVVGFRVDQAFPIGADRLFVTGDDGSLLYSADGQVVATFPPGTASTGEEQPMVPVTVGTDCIGLQPGYTPALEAAGVQLVDLASGDVLLELDATPYLARPDGCTLVTPGDPLLVIDGAVVDVDLDSVMAVRPDGAIVIGLERGDDPRIFSVDLASGERTELPKALYRFAEF